MSEYLHKRVIFVGDRPNVRKNASLDVPFVGTKSYKTLLEWIYRMDLDINLIHVCNAFSADGTPLEILRDDELQIATFHVALGEIAAQRLKQLSIECFRLPHPSGLNRKLNDKQEISRLLYRCKKFIYK